jgi:hypothetical protein
MDECCSGQNRKFHTRQRLWCGSGEKRQAFFLQVEFVVDFFGYALPKKEWKFVRLFLR